MREESGDLSRDAGGRLRWGKRAAGVLIERDDTGEVLLLLRSRDVMDPGVWGIPGGRVEPGEGDLAAAMMETEEEVGPLPKLEVVGEHQAVSGGFTYITFHAVMVGRDAERFTPTLNWESEDWGWFPVSTPPRSTHPGALDVLGKIR